MANIIEQIHKLRQLSKSDNINEAAAAAAAADKLIAKHRISEQEIEDADPSKKELVIEDTNVLYETARTIHWKRALAGILSENYGCFMWNDCNYHASIGGRKISRYRLAGRINDMNIVHFMFAWLSNEIERLTKYNCKGKGYVYSQSYSEGAVNGIKEQLNASQEAIKTQAAQEGKSAFLVKLNERMDEAEQLTCKLHNLKYIKGKSYRHLNSEALVQGIKDGRNIHLGKALSVGTNLLGK